MAATRLRLRTRTDGKAVIGTEKLQIFNLQFSDLLRSRQS